MLSIPDPWSAREPIEDARSNRALASFLAWLIGSAGPVLHAYDLDGSPLADALGLAATGALWALLLHRTRRTSALRSALGVVGGLALAALLNSVLAGWSSGVVVVLGVGITHVALLGWRQEPDPSPSEPQQSPVAILLVVASTLSWWRSGPTITSYVLLAVGALFLGARQLWEPPRTVDQTVERVLGALGTAVAVALVAVVALPLLYLPAAVMRLLRGTGRAEWRDVEVTPHQSRSFARNPFGPVDPSTRTRRNVAGLALVAVAGAVTVAAVLDGPAERTDPTGRDNPIARTREVRFSDLEAFEGVPFADELKAEQDRFANRHVRFDEETWFSYSDFEGRYTNFRGGARVTPAPPPCDCSRTASVWMLGGSAAFGLGQRDDHTVAAELVREAADAGVALEVTNLGVPGWTIWQEMRALKARLASGAPPPDLVVLYDGFNDIVGALTESIANGFLAEGRPNLLLIHEVTPVESRGYRLEEEALVSVADTAAERYLSLLEEIRSLGETYGVEVVAVLQPDAIADPVQLDAVRPVVSSSLLASMDAVEAMMDRFEKRLGPDVVDLRHVVDDHGSPVFADLVHMNEDGARLVADAMLPTVLERLQG